MTSLQHAEPAASACARRKHGVRLLVALALSSVVALAAAEPVGRRFRATELLLALETTAQGSVHQAAEAVVESALELETPRGTLRARLYRRAGRSSGPGLVMAHGVHHLGIDEPRLTTFARELARAGRVVLTPELADLAAYRITTQAIEGIVDSTRWLSEQPALVGSPRVGMLGFSFAGGLCLVAAGRPELRDRVEYVASVGGHHDLSRVLAFLIDERIETPAGAKRARAHEYGLLLLVYQHLSHFVDEADRAVLSDALGSWLREERALAWARASLRTTESGERLFQLLATGRLRDLAPRLSEQVHAREAELRALSPRGQLQGLAVPIYLLHGSHDSVVPPSETEWAALELQGSRHRALVSPLLEHVEISGSARLRDELALIDFLARLL
jgi:dienelactone hydrolase